jgi:hypothetical protein
MSPREIWTTPSPFPVLICDTQAYLISPTFGLFSWHMLWLVTSSYFSGNGHRLRSSFWKGFNWRVKLSSSLWGKTDWFGQTVFWWSILSLARMDKQAVVEYMLLAFEKDMILKSPWTVWNTIRSLWSLCPLMLSRVTLPDWREQTRPPPPLCRWGLDIVNWNVASESSISV